MANGDPPDGPSTETRPAEPHSENSYLGSAAAGAARREVRHLPDGRRITFYGYRPGTHMTHLTGLA